MFESRTQGRRLGKMMVDGQGLISFLEKQVLNVSETSHKGKVCENGEQEEYRRHLLAVNNLKEHWGDETKMNTKHWQRLTSSCSYISAHHRQLSCSVSSSLLPLFSLLLFICLPLCQGGNSCTLVLFHLTVYETRQNVWQLRLPRISLSCSLLGVDQ